MITEECSGGFQASAFRAGDGTALVFRPKRGSSAWIRTSPPLRTAADGGHRPARIDGQEAAGGREFSPRVGKSGVSLRRCVAGVPPADPVPVHAGGIQRRVDRGQSEAGELLHEHPAGSLHVQGSGALLPPRCVESPAAYAFVLSPHFYQTTWFTLALLAVAISLAGGAFQLYRRDRERELRASRLESQLSQAKLRVLEMQLRPHFLFNTLNSIMVLITRDPRAAERTLARLSDLLRHTLERSGVQEVRSGRRWRRSTAI